jgi:hypothetical protein
MHPHFSGKGDLTPESILRLEDELERAGIPHTVIADSAAGSLITESLRNASTTAATR